MSEVERPFYSYAVLMNPGQITQICPEAMALGRVRLIAYRLIFSRPSGPWLGGIPNLEEKDGAEVWGVLWRVCRTHLRDLDHYQQGLGPPGAQGYCAFSVIVEDAEGAPLEAFAYRFAAPSHGTFPPSAEFLDTVLRAAHEFGFPEEYIAALERLA